MKPIIGPLIFAASALAPGCFGGEPQSVYSADAMKTIEELLILHDLKGRMPEERTDLDRRRAVDEKALGRLFVDYDSEDPFLRSLYVGFLAGALARHQHALAITRTGDRAVAHAGPVQVVMVNRQGRWLIALDKSIPGEIKTRAMEARERSRPPRVASAR